METQSAPPTKISRHMAPPVRLSGVAQAIDPALVNIHTARAARVTRMMGPAYASYLRIMSMPYRTMMTCTIHRNTKVSQPSVDRPRIELWSMSLSPGLRAISNTRSTREAR